MHAWCSSDFEGQRKKTEADPQRGSASVFLLRRLLDLLRRALAQALIDDALHLAVRFLGQSALLRAEFPLLRTQLALFRPELALLFAEFTLLRASLALQFTQSALQFTKSFLNLRDLLLADLRALFGLELRHRLVDLRNLFRDVGGGNGSLLLHLAKRLLLASQRLLLSAQFLLLFAKIFHRLVH